MKRVVYFLAKCFVLRHCWCVDLMDHYWLTTSWLRTWAVCHFVEADSSMWVLWWTVGGWWLRWVAIGLFQDIWWWGGGIDEDWRLKRGWWRWVSEMLAGGEWMTGLLESYIILLMWFYDVYRHCSRLFCTVHAFALCLITLALLVFDF